MPTLGKVRNHLRAAGEAYEYILPGKDRAGSIVGVVGMLTDLWEGHSDRHAGRSALRSSLPGSSRGGLHPCGIPGHRV